MQITRRDMLKASVVATTALITTGVIAQEPKKIITGFEAIDAQLPNGLQRGSICLIIGKTGAGKTTLAHHIKELNQFDNIDIVEQDNEILNDLRHKAYVLQNATCLYNYIKEWSNRIKELHQQAISNNQLVIITQPIKEMADHAGPYIYPSSALFYSSVVFKIRDMYSECLQNPTRGTVKVFNELSFRKNIYGNEDATAKLHFFQSGVWEETSEGLIPPKYYSSMTNPSFSPKL